MDQPGKFACPRCRTTFVPGRRAAAAAVNCRLCLEPTARVPTLMAEPRSDEDLAWLPYLSAGSAAVLSGANAVAGARAAVLAEQLPAIVMYSQTTGVNTPRPRLGSMAPVPVDLTALLTVRKMLRELDSEDLADESVDLFLFSGPSLFESDIALNLWIRTPHSELGGMTPMAQLSNVPGTETVRGLLRAMRAAANKKS